MYNDCFVFIIPKEFKTKAKSISKDTYLYTLDKAAHLRGIAECVQIKDVKPGNYLKFHMTEIPTFNHVIMANGKMIQKIGRDVSCEWAIVTVDNGKMIFNTARGYTEENLLNGMILLER